MELDKLKQINDQRQRDMTDMKRHAENQQALIGVQETVVHVVNGLVDYLDKRISRTEVINQLQEIGTPDVQYVVDAINNLHDTVSKHENTDLTTVTALLTGILDEAKQIPKSLPEQEEQKFVDYTPRFKELESALNKFAKAINDQEITVEAPTVNVPAPQVNVDAPDLTPLHDRLEAITKAVKNIVIPEQKETDLGSVEKLLKAQNKTLNAILDKPVGGGGGGGGRVSPFEDSQGIPAFPVLENGRLPVASPGLFTKPYDAIVTNYTDSGKQTVSTIVTSLNGVTQETITFTSGATSDTYERS